MKRLVRLIDVRQYALVLLSVGIALAISLPLQHFAFRVPAALLLLLAVAISSWYGGPRASLLAVILSVIALDWYFLEPRESLSIAPHQIPYFIVFAVFASLLSWFSTIRRRIEAALRTSEAYLAEGQRLSHTGSFAWDAAGEKLVYCSQETFRILGVDPKNGLPSRDTLLRLVVPEDRDRIAGSLRTAVREKVDTVDEYRIALPDGTIKDICTIRHPVLDRAGDVVRVMGTVIDITDRKRAEAELRASEERFRTLVQFSFDVYWESDAQHRFTRQEFSAGLADAPAPGSEIGKTRWEVPYLEPDEEAWREHRATLDAHLPFRDFELARPTAEGGKRYVSVSGLPVFDSTGRFLGYRGVGRHITGRKRAEQALRQSEAYLAEAQRLSHSGSWAFDVASDTYVYMSDESFRIWGFDPQEGLPAREAIVRRIDPDDRDRINASQQKSFREKVETFDEYRIMLPDGTTKHVHTIRRPILNDAGEVVGLVGTTIDITERKRAEEALRESETRFRTFVDHAADAFFMLDFEQGTIIDVNRRACESLGYPREELVGMRPLAFDADLDRASLESITKRTAEGETVLFDRHWHRRKDGALFPVEVQISVFWHGGRRFLLKVARDISDRLQGEEQRARLRQLEAELAHINRVSLMGELTTSIAHEVNQPLSGVVSNGSACLRWLAGDVPNLEEARDAARRIVRDGKRAAEVIARVRAMTTRGATPTERLDLNHTIQEVLAIIGDEAKRTSAVIHTQLADDLAPVAGDRVQLQQVVLNLVMNAIEAMSSAGERAREVVITTRDVDADHVQVTVEDSGTGLDPNATEKVFEPFYTTKPSGMGMGLSICRSIVQRHGGRLWATAKDGGGAMFHFALPKYREEGPHDGVEGH